MNIIRYAYIGYVFKGYACTPPGYAPSPSLRLSLPSGPNIYHEYNEYMQAFIELAIWYGGEGQRDRRVYGMLNINISMLERNIRVLVTQLGILANGV